MPLKRKLENFLLKLSLLAGGIVLLFSILNGYSFLMILLRAALSFLFIYFLGRGLMELGERILPPSLQQEEEYPSMVDVFLGDINSKGVNQAEGLTNTYSRIIPGQVNIDMKNELEDAKNKAEIVRRMGWGEEEVSD